MFLHLVSSTPQQQLVHSYSQSKFSSIPTNSTRQLITLKSRYIEGYSKRPYEEHEIVSRRCSSPYQTYFRRTCLQQLELVYNRESGTGLKVARKNTGTATPKAF